VLKFLYIFPCQPNNSIFHIAKDSIAVNVKITPGNITNGTAKLCVSVRNYAVLFDSVLLFRIRNECDVDFSVKTLDESEFTA
jgi:hypothetical protein